MPFAAGSFPIATLVALAVLCAQCNGNGGAPEACRPSGLMVVCTCANGTQSVRTCLPSGSFGACNCTDGGLHPGADGTDVGSSHDAADGALSRDARDGARSDVTLADGSFQCVPRCDNVVCGNADGCGGTCGCDQEQRCVLITDPPGIMLRPHPPGLCTQSCGGILQDDVTSDGLNCGSCGNACWNGTGTQRCAGGECGTTCGSGPAVPWMDLASDPRACGSCMHRCALGATCQLATDSRTITPTPTCSDCLDNQWTCGVDLSGNSCGSCPAGQECPNTLAPRSCCMPQCNVYIDGVLNNCGDDQCGGSCGTCPSGQVCAYGSSPVQPYPHDQGTCCTPHACTPTCGADDGCGNPCPGSTAPGSCPPGQICNQTRCVACVSGVGSACSNQGTPCCAGLECLINPGWTSESCNSVHCSSSADCAPGMLCAPNGSCVRPCGPSDPCNAGMTCCNGFCAWGCCRNCNGKSCGDDGCGGNCGTCSSGQACNAGVCVTPPSGYPTGTDAGTSTGNGTTTPGLCDEFAYCITVTAAYADPTICDGGGQIVIRNDCIQTVTISACLGHTDGTWDCGEDDIAPGANFTYWGCHLNGLFCDQGTDPALWGTGCALTGC